MLKVVVVFLFVDVLAFCQTCNVHPTMWCEDDRIADQCGALAACQKYKIDSRGQRLKVTLFYETLCPDCQKFIVNQLNLESGLWKTARDFIDFQFVPYGNAKIRPDGRGGKEVVCQHGSTECALNVLHGCAIKYLNYDQNRWFPFIHCMEEKLSKGEDPTNATLECFKSACLKPLERKSILHCNATEYDQIQEEMAKLTDQAWPEKHTFVPWILINNISLTNNQVYQEGIVEHMCTWYNNKEKPAGCDIFGKNKMKDLRTDFD